MKKNLEIKLNQLSKAELSEKEMNRLLGGDNCCICGCKYANYGGSSDMANGQANYAGGESGLYSPGGGSVAFGNDA